MILQQNPPKTRYLKIFLKTFLLQILILFQNIFPLESIQPTLFLEDKGVGLQVKMCPSSILLFDLVMEGDLPEEKREESNFLAESNEIVAQSLSEMKKS